MGVHTTLTVSRSAAMLRVYERLNSCTNDDLDMILFFLVGDRNGFNFSVVDSPGQDDDARLEGLK